MQCCIKKNLCNVGYSNIVRIPDHFVLRSTLSSHQVGGNLPKTMNSYSIRDINSSARNVVERAFKTFRGWWVVILQGKSFYLVQIQCRIIIACCLLHNLIYKEMSQNPLFLKAHPSELNANEMSVRQHKLCGNNGDID